MSELEQYLLTRRSVQAGFLQAPAPDEDQIKTMLTIAARVPDHKKLAPWRFIRFDADACKVIGEKLADHIAGKKAQVSEERLEMERGRFTRAPLVIGVVYSPAPGEPVPAWEQVMSSGAVCMNLVHAAHALGFAAQWLSEWYSFDSDMLKMFGLAEDERIAGFIHVGTPSITPTERPRPEIDDLVTHWRA